MTCIEFLTASGTKSLIDLCLPLRERENNNIFELYSSLYLNTASHLIGTPRWLLPFYTQLSSPHPPIL